MDDRANGSDSMVSSPNSSVSNKRKASLSEANPRPSKRAQQKQPQRAEAAANDRSDHRSFNVISPSPSRVTLSPTISSPPRGALQVREVTAGVERGTNHHQHVRNVVYNSPSTADGSQHHRDVYINTGTAALQWLQKYAMTGAEYNSSERDPPPRCHPGTRTAILGRGHSWFQDLRRNFKLLWLTGPTGVGKTTIIQTLIESLAHSDHLGAGVFLSLTDHRTSPTKLLPTIAHQLAVRDHTYRAYIEELMNKNPSALENSLDEQFRLLILDPFAKRKIRDGASKVWLIALDGLDECGDSPAFKSANTAAKNSAQQHQCTIIRLISRFILSYPNVPLKWLISTCPEAHLRTIFDRESVRKCLTIESIPMGDIDSRRDVERYLHHEFHEIRQSYPESKLPQTWPSNKQLIDILTAAKGLFVFAFVVAGFIADREVGNPVAQLQIVLDLLDEMRVSTEQKDPLAALDAMYIRILSKTPNDTLSTTKRILGSCILLGKLQFVSNQTDLCFISNVLGITQDAALTSLRQLRLDNGDSRNSRGVLESSRRRSLVYHSSFQDFLVDKQRSREYWVDVRTIGTEVFWSLLEHKLKFLSSQKSTPHQPFTLTWQPDPSYAADVNSKLSKYVEEAWMSLLRGASGWGQVFRLTHYHIEISISPEKLIEILERMNFDRMFRECLGAQKFWFVWDLCKTEFFRRELENVGFLKFVSLASLGVEKLINEENVEVIPDHPCIRFHRVETTNHTPSDVEATYVKELLSWTEMMPQKDVRILGREEGKRCALFAGPRRAGQSSFYLITCV